MAKAPLSWVLGVSDRFEHLTRFTDTIESQIAQVLREQESIVERTESDDRYEVETWLLATMRDTFPRHLRYAAIVTVYAEVEAVLTGLCEHVQRRRKVPFSVHDIVGHGFDGYALYLERTIGVRIRERAFWKELQLIAKVRHCIAHVGGHVPSTKKPAAIPGTLNALGLKIDGDDYIKVPKAAPLRMIEYAKGWLYEVVADIERALRSGGKED